MMGNRGRQFLIVKPDQVRGPGFCAAKDNGLIAAADKRAGVSKRRLHRPKACRPAINGTQPTGDRALACPLRTRSGDRVAAVAMDPHESRLQNSSGRTRMSMRSAARE